ncbi:MAG: choice-of-anchor D domain-containing protein, partial [Candidatus Marinimicrobia bacterium]|nr:choice-of-anchor D domain-containing protein [Candidatus Neomarinimicrobiota bacterium]
LDLIYDDIKVYNRSLSDQDVVDLYNGIEPTNAVLTITPSSLDFSYILVGETATEQVVVKNTGIADLNVSSISISGADSSNFDVDTMTFTLVPDDSLFLDVNFTPDDTGSFSASLDIGSDGGNASVELTGTGFEIAGNYALDFDGTDDYVEVPDDESLEPSNEITVEAWIRITGSASEIHAIIAKRVWESDCRGYLLRIKGSDNTPGFTLYGGEGYNRMLCSAGPILDNEWYHIVGTYDGTNIKIYVNGVESNTEPFSSFNPISSSSLYIGFDIANGGSYFNGNIDEVRIWNIARTQEEIQANMSHHLVGDEEGLVGYWRMDEGSGQTLVDWSINENHGQLGSNAGVDDSDPAWLGIDWPYGSPELLVSPISIDFGDVVVGEIASEPVMVSNNGTA